MPERITLRIADSLRPATINEATRTATARLLSGAEIARTDPYTGEDVYLRFEPNGADLERLRAGAVPVLIDHQADTVENVVGSVEALRVSRGEVLVDLRFGASERAESVFQRVLAGELRAISGGFEVIESEDARDGDGRLIRTVRRWSLYEVSLVAVPADPRAVVLSFDDGVQKMTNPIPTPSNTPAGDLGAQIHRLVSAAGLPASVAVELAAQCETLEAAREKVLARLAAEANRVPTRSHSTVTVTRDGGETLRLGLQEALYARAARKEPGEIGRPYAGISLVRAAEELLRNRGERLFGFSPERTIEASMTAGDFPNLLQGVGARILLESYDAAAPELRRICRRSTAQDFRDQYRLRVGEAPQLLEIRDGAEVTYGSIDERSASYRLKTYARIFSLSREGLVNDDLNALGDMMRAFAIQAAAVEGAAIASLINDNAVAPDGVPLFDANHGNLAGSGGTISVSTVGAGRAAMRRQTGIDGKTILDIQPSFIVVPASRQTEAEQLVTAISPAQVSNANPFVGKLEVVADARLDNGSTTAWYLFADPSRLPVIEYAYLAEAQGPQVRSREGWERLGVEFRCVFDFGCGVLDYRGAYKNPGA